MNIFEIFLFDLIIVSVHDIICKNESVYIRICIFLSSFFFFARKTINLVCFCKKTMDIFLLKNGYIYFK